MSAADSVTINEIRAAHELIRPFIHQTPIVHSSYLSSLAGFDVYLKCEHLQKAGSFKIRGALHSVLKMTPEELKRGVLTHSSGNHGQAVALAAKMKQAAACVVMPNNSPKCKSEATASYGAQVVFCEPSTKAREETCQKLEAETGALMIPPYNSCNVIAGQGTVAIEILENLGNVDCIIAPISGGGLISGITIAAKALKPNILIVAAEPLGANDASKSKSSGTLQSCVANTIADGLRVAQLGSLTWPVVRDITDAVVTVTEEEIIQAMRLLFERTKQVVEPSGSVSVAVALSDEFKKGIGRDCKRVVCVLSGGNVDIDELPWK